MLRMGDRWWVTNTDPNLEEVAWNERDEAIQTSDDKDNLWEFHGRVLTSSIMSPSLVSA